MNWAAKSVIASAMAPTPIYTALDGAVRFCADVGHDDAHRRNAPNDRVLVTGLTSSTLPTLPVVMLVAERLVASLVRRDLIGTST